ncbi:MAG: cysteine--tRNA ligase [Methanosarcinaceae archaeon]|nr:cysteine--tRNA ligase [Methanosarcinaceae archaeon]
MLQVYNTLSRKKEVFVPLEPGRVSIYACGPTVYNLPHIGNYRTFFMTDNLVRTLEYLGYAVKLVMNITDIDDKTIRDSEEAGMSLRAFTEKYTEEFFRGLDLLKIRRASEYPRATENVAGMIELSETLMEKGLAYEKDGSVYFRISAFPAYGKLSKIDPDRIKVGASVDVDEYEKDNPRDFALLKASSSEEVSRGIYYESPWGKIRPGWHTECSVMAMKAFGPTLDIHTGGVDLIFPHHENEIAQAEGATGLPFVRYWVHGEHLIVSGEKMSKSKGNFFTLPEIVEEYGGEVVRFMFLSVHYRKKLDYTKAFAENAKNNYQRLRETLDTLEFLLPSADRAACPGAGKTPETLEILEKLPKLEAEFRAALEDDLDTPKALQVFRELSRSANIYLESGKTRKDLEKILELYRTFAAVLGLFEKKEGSEKVPAEVLKMVEERETARKEKDWGKADRLRERIKELGYAVQDMKEGAQVKKID